MLHVGLRRAALLSCGVSLFAGSAGVRADSGICSKPVGVGIVGTGWGLKVQVPAFRAVGFTMSAIYSRSLGRAQQIAAEHGISRGFDSVEALCACDDVQLVSCVGPAHTRKAHTLAALAARKHVLVDKPMALDTAEASEMLAASRVAHESAGCRAFMDFELRACPGVVRAKALLASGELGAVQHLSFRCLQGMSFLSGARPHSHWNQRECGGGVFSAVGISAADPLKPPRARRVQPP